MAEVGSPLKNLEIEQALLGSLLIDGSRIFEVCTVIEPDDFASSTHSTIYSAMLDIAHAGKEIDLLVLSDELERQGKLAKLGHKNIHGAAYISWLPTVTPTSVHAVHYAKTVRDYALRRRLLNVAQKIVTASHDSDSGEQALTQALTWLNAVNQHATVKLQPISEAVDEFTVRLTDWLERPREVWGLSTGLKDLDELTGGLEQGEFVIIAGRPGMGKSSLALQIARHVAEEGHGVVFFSLEMSINQLMMRLTCSGAKVDSGLVRRGKLSEYQREKLWDELLEIQRLPLWWCCHSNITTREATNEVARLQTQHDIALVIFDYIQLARAKGESQNIRVSKISQGLKHLAVTLNVCVVGVSQLSRAIESRLDPEPRLSDLRDSGSLEQDADKVIFLHRNKDDKTVQVILAKNRNGAANIGLRQLVFLPEYTMFGEIMK